MRALHCCVAAWLLALSATAQQIAFEGKVFEADDSPAEGAVVVSDLGGQAVTDADGLYRLEVEVPSGTASVQITAVGSGSAMASASVTVPSGAVHVPVGPLVLALGSTCEPSWLPTFGGPRGVDDLVRAVAVYDYGNGASLFAGGDFTFAGGMPANHIVEWNGTTWSELDTGTNSTVWALTVFDDGNGSKLYAGGNFITAGGVPVGGIAKWDGTSWSSVGPIAGSVFALAVYDDGNGPALYAAGSLFLPGTGSLNNIGKWDGTTWSALGTGTNGLVWSLAVHDEGNGPALYAGGTFEVAGGISAQNVAKWDGSTWSALGAGVNGTVTALGSYDDGSGSELYAGGYFLDAGGVAANKIAKWDGANWSPLGSGLDNEVEAFCVYDDGSGDALYVGGVFSTAGGVAADHIARWDGTSWSAVGAGVGNAIFDLTIYDDGGGPALFAGGFFTSAGGSAADFIASWDGSNWDALGTEEGLNDAVLAVTVFDDGGGEALYVAGQFTHVGGLAVNRIAKWDGSTWSALGTGLDQIVYALAVYDDGGGPELYAGGRFSTAGGVLASRIAKWDGSTWSVLGTGMNIFVYALAVHDDGGGPALFAGGSFSTAGGVPANHIAKWNGTNWSALGSGINSTVYALGSFDLGSGPALYAGGKFSSAGGTAASRVAEWDGVSWSALGSGVNGEVDALAAFDDGGGPALFVGGTFSTAGGAAASRAAKWNGSGWSALGSGVNNRIRGLGVFDAGGGPRLYAGGDFVTAGGMPASRVAAWDGSSWTTLGSGINNRVYAMNVFDSGSGPSLYVGSLGTAIDTGDIYLAKWDSVDTSPPVLTCRADMTVECASDSGALVDFSVTATDDCDPAPMIVSVPASGSSFPFGTTTVTSTATDSSGNVSMCQFDVTVEDTAAPMLTCPSDVTLECTNPSGEVVDFTPTVSDVCDSSPLVVSLPPSGSTFSLGTTTVTVTAADGSGNESMCTFDVTIEDTTAPALTCPDLVVECTGSGGTPVTFTPTVTDACDPAPSVVAVPPSGSSFSLGTTMVNVTATDASGNASMCSFSVTVQDTTAPALVCPSDVTAECAGPGGTSVEFALSAGDACDPAPSVVAVPPSGTLLPLGTTTVSVTATDASGNVSMCSFDVTVEDTTAPALVCPSDVVLECTNPTGEVVSYAPTATDGCDTAPLVVAVPASGSTFPLGTTVVAVTATDASGNVSMCSFSVTVEDTVAPVLKCSGDQTVECSGPGGTPVSFSSTATDACDPAPSVVCSPPSGSAFPLGTTMVTCTATDASGNASMCSFSVTVEDTAAPALACPADVTVECTNPKGEVVGFAPRASDGCDASPAVVAVPPSGSTFPLGTTPVLVTATDATGNASMCTFSVIVEDTVAPVITCPADVSIQCADPKGEVVVFTPTATDACDPGPVIVSVPPSGSLFPPGTTTVFCTATDGSGNSSMCTFDVTITVDTAAPSITCPADVSIDCTSPKGAPVSFTVTATDDCDGSPNVVSSPPSGSVFPPGVTTVTCTATDAAGNASMCTFDVTITADTTAPTIECPADVLVQCADSKGEFVMFAPTATDDCDPSPAIVSTPPSGSLFPPGTTAVFCTATDAAGNSSMCSFDVTITPDTSAPSITCPADITVDCTGSKGAPVSFSASATDDCDPSPNVVASPPSGSLFPPGVTLVSVTATDASGNASMCTFGVTVNADTTAPVITCPADVVIPCADPKGELVTFTPTATDDCDPSPAIVSTPPSGSLFPPGTTTVFCTATDAAGNSSMCTFDVTVELDVTAPAITCPGDFSVPCAEGGAVVTYSVDATDACDASPSLVCTPPSGSTFPLGPTTVTCTATDSSGNSSMCSFLVTVQDTIAPMVACPGTVVVALGNPAFYNVSATDNCDPAPVVVCSPPSGTVFTLGQHTVTCMATDASGNVGFCSFFVVVVGGGSGGLPALGPLGQVLLAAALLGAGVVVARRRG